MFSWYAHQLAEAKLGVTLGSLDHGLRDETTHQGSRAARTAQTGSASA